MGKKPIVSVTYENERISIKNSLSYLKCVLRLSCVVHGPIYGFLCKRFALQITVILRENRLHKNQEPIKNPQNGHKSARGPHRRDVTHILSKVSCFFFIEILSFS